MIYPFEGGNQYLRKPQKIFLHNTTLFYTLQQFVGETFYPGTLRELYFIQALRDANESVYYSKQADYRTKNRVFEIGGKNKTAKQIAHLDIPALLVKDDIVTASKQVIPLLFLALPINFLVGIKINLISRWYDEAQLLTNFGGENR